MDKVARPQLAQGGARGNTLNAMCATKDIAAA